MANLELVPLQPNTTLRYDLDMFTGLHFTQFGPVDFCQFLTYTSLSVLQKVEPLCNKGIKKVCCGTQFSVALGADGHVYTFGQGEVFIDTKKNNLVYF